MRMKKQLIEDEEAVHENPNGHRKKKVQRRKNM